MVVSTMYLVVTVTVDRRQVILSVIAALAIQVMDFNHGFRRENESTGLA